MAIKTLSELFRSGAHFTAEQIVRAGHGVKELIAALRRRFGNDYQATNRTANELLQRAQQSVDIANRIERGATISPADMPIDPSQDIRGFYQYRVIIEADIRTGPSGDQIEKIRTALRIPSDLQLTEQEILDIAEGMLRNRSDRIQSPPLLAFANQMNRVERATVIKIISGYRPPRAR